MTEIDRAVEEQCSDLEWLDRAEHQAPLACSVLWTAPRSPCDQRRSVVAAMRAPTVTVVLGGERSGKSKGVGKDLTLAMALGSDEPAVQRWLWLNRLPKDVIPPGPAQVYAVARGSGDSVRYHRPDFAKMVGALPHRWVNRNAKGEGLLEIRTTHHRDPAKIWFMSIEQGAAAMQGITLRWAWLDEEPLGEQGLAVYRHLRGRVADQDGRIGITMVPSEGITWVHDRLLRDREDEAVVVELDTLDNPHLPQKRFQRHFAGMDDDEVAIRRYGRFRSREGVVYSFWAPGDGDRWGPGHLCEPFDIPADWPRFKGVDFGLVNPTCVLWGALGDDDTLYIYREHYEGGPSFAEHARQVRDLECGEVFEGGWGDPSAREAIEDWALEDIYLDRANNDVKAGIDAVKERIRCRDDNRPRLKVFSGCENLIREMRGYVWDSKRRDEVPVKKNDHAVDALRYLVMGVREWRGL